LADFVTGRYIYLLAVIRLNVLLLRYATSYTNYSLMYKQELHR